MTDNSIKCEFAVEKINRIVDEIRKIWSDLNVYNIEQLKSAWKDEVCREYVDRINLVDNNINSIIDNLEDLKNYWILYKNNDLDNIEGGSNNG